MAIQKSGRMQFQDLLEVVGAGAFSVNPAQFVDNESQEVNLTVPGAALGDFVLVAAGVDVTESVVSAQVTAADTVSIVIGMLGGDTNDVAVSNWNVLVLRLNPAFAIV